MRCLNSGAARLGSRWLCTSSAARPLAGRIALVTGGGTGVGAAVCTGLAARGATVLVNYSRSAREAEETARLCEAAGAPEVAVERDAFRRSDAIRT